MKATALQTLLGLHAVNLEIRDSIEILIAVVAALAAVALRRRTLALRSRGFAMIATSLAIDLLVPSFGLGTTVATWLEALALTLFLWAAISLTRQLYDGLTRRRRLHFSTIFRDLIVALLYSVALLAVLRYTVKVDLTSLLAGSAVVAAVIGFGLQEALGNIFNGLTLQMQTPFEPGEWVRLQNQVGRVQGVGWRSTRIVTRNNERLEIPNSVVAKDVLTNYAAAGRVADEISIGLPYGEPPNRVKELAMEVLGGMPQVLRDPPPEIYAWEFGDFAIKYRIKYWMAEYGPAEIVRSEVITRMWYALHRHSIEIPFPIRTVYMHQAKAERDAGAGSEETLLSELRSVEVLSSLSDDELRLLTRDMSIHQFAHGEMLMHEGEIAQSLHILRHGKVEIVGRGPKGDAFVRDLIAPDVLGEISLMLGIPRTASVRAVTEVEALVVSKEGFTRLLKARPEIAEEIAKIIAPRMAETEERVAAAHAAEAATTVPGFIAKMRQIFQV